MSVSSGPITSAGYLLTDDDLTTGVRYVREKNKLYHRTLHGSGIVCGLGLRRDLDCPGLTFSSAREATPSILAATTWWSAEQQSFNVDRGPAEEAVISSLSHSDPCKGPAR